MTRVGFFHDDDPAVLPEFPGELAAADVHGKNLGGAVLEKTIREAAGGRTKVKGSKSGHVQLKMVQGMFELVAAAAGVFFGRFQRQVVIRSNVVAGFVCRLGVDADLSGKDRAFGTFAALTKATVNQSLVEASHYEYCGKLSDARRHHKRLPEAYKRFWTSRK